MKIIVEHLNKAFGTKTVLKDVTLTVTPEKPCCLMGPSGSGKTTLFRILLGLEKQDSGTLSFIPPGNLAAVFQENRLCETFTPIDNLLMAAGKTLSRQKAREELARILPYDCLNLPVSTMSGGMKRRTAICRALLAPSHGILMDEPFTGLDEDTKLLVISYIKEKAGGKLLFLSTHQEEDIALLDARLIRLNP